MIDKETLRDVKSQLQTHLEYLTKRIDDLYRMGYIVNRGDWLYEERVNCEDEIWFWEDIDGSTKEKC